MPTDTSEKGLETLIMRHLTGVDGLSADSSGLVAESKPTPNGNGWIAGSSAAYDQEFAVDTVQL
ncbi:MAG: hypothetical protein KDM63_09925, partial [Verrucomicrobiae bacterium]|nr:hypothetical protein [Verrucomicrobiae bacterium]